MSKKRLYAKTVEVSSLSEDDKRAMQLIFQKYYDNFDDRVFEKDLKDKDIVFVLRDMSDHNIKGFSTLKNLDITSKNKKIRGCFSGDTVIEKEYWGQGTLGKAFLKYLFLQKLRHPFRPLYWYLISKGYKTYLLMANNFSTHYPRYEKETPEQMKQIMDNFSQTLYPNEYDKKLGLIKFSGTTKKDCLKNGITPIDKRLLLENSRISFFVQKNPDWDKGDELACIARMTLFMPIFYQSKYIMKSGFKLFKKIKAGGRKMWNYISQDSSKRRPHEL